MESDQLKVFLVDDDAAIRRMLTSALTRRGIAVEAFDSATAFLAHPNVDELGCLLLDISMPGMTGLELQQELARSPIDIPIIFITGKGNIPQSVQAIKAGAIDFIEKPFDLDALVKRIEEAFATASMLRSDGEYRSSVRARFETLTEREYEVMHLLIADAVTASSKQIAATLGISHRTVDHHRANIMEKTGARSVTELLQLASWAGVIQIDPTTR